MHNATLNCFRVLSPTETQRLCYGILYTILTVVSSVLNILLIWLVFSQRRKTKRICIYKPIVSLNISTMFYLLCNYPVLLPCTYSTCSSYDETTMIVIASLNTLGYYTSFFTNTCIAFERIFLFLVKSLHEFLEKYIIFYLAVPWGIGLFITGATTGMGCYKRFNTFTTTYTFGCGKCVLGRGFSVTLFLFWVCQALSGIMFVGYAAVMVKFQFIQKPANTGKRLNEIRLVIQFLLICTFQWFSCFFFYMVPFVFGTSFQGSLALNITGMGNTMVNPIILMVFNKTIRDGLLRLLGFKSGVIHPELLLSVVGQSRLLNTTIPQMNKRHPQITSLVPVLHYKQPEREDNL